ncbi:L10-interacting MYB domain-containing protein-like [Impatiens glandulifera]|uniref:L10-interacting MYB domain-containing protein-like n=1 Tax=Impatiens glandulifera TaxID=253017 RepID=UPI001FB1421E|nr:L10-interacting MYB domain-containing protein-like [Impatiens glandulifera]XP_047319757.1 L10-interacting MYB domain-containing protein-like [Impatiens glandulifera]
MATRVTRSGRQPSKENSDQQLKARWTTTLTKILVDLMVEQVRFGNKQKDTFNRKGWKFINDDFQKRSGLKWSLDQLKTQYDVLKRQHSIMKTLLEQMNFAFDESRGTIRASDEDWEIFIKANPEAETLRTNGCPVYKELCTIFSQTNNTNKDYDLIVKEEIVCPEPLCMIHEPSSESEKQDYGINSKKRVRRGVNQAISEAISEMAAASRHKTTAIEQINNRFSITDCVKALDEVKGIEERLYYAALDLFHKPIARETFLFLRADKRLAWLSRKCSNRSI